MNCPRASSSLAESKAPSSTAGADALSGMVILRPVRCGRSISASIGYLNVTATVSLTLSSGFSRINHLKIGIETLGTISCSAFSLRVIRNDVLWVRVVSGLWVYHSLTF